ncbi:MAG: hypothetical protein R2755_26130 [Acidimicrobiales bacterium]
MNVRIRQSHGQAKFKYVLEVDEAADRDDGTLIRDSAVRERLKAKGFENLELEWMRCTAEDVLTAIKELRTGQALAGTHHEDFPMRAEQEAAVNKTAAYYESIWAEDSESVPRFLWNAKMWFGKTSRLLPTLAKRLGAKKVLVVTFKPAVETRGRPICGLMLISTDGSTFRRRMVAIR